MSSGDAVRHRLSRSGDRQLNNAVHLAAHVQRCNPSPGQDDYLRKIAEGKTNEEAMRGLKRQAAKVIYRRLTDDTNRLLATQVTAAAP